MGTERNCGGRNRGQKAFFGIHSGRHSLLQLLSLAALLVLLSACEQMSAPVVDEGPLSQHGSSTLMPAAQAWAEAYRTLAPDVEIDIAGGGSSKGIGELITGTIELANASRKIRAEELAMADSVGVQPVEHVVGSDAVAVYVHPDNPVASMDLTQLAQIYGENGTIENWTQLEVEVPGCPSGEIVAIGREPASGTHAFFRDNVLGEQDFRDATRELENNPELFALVAGNPCGIAYAGLANERTVRTVCLSRGSTEECVEPTFATAADATYPLARSLYVYSRGEPAGRVRDYLDYVLSDAGQCQLLEVGFAPVRSVSCT